MDWTKKRKHYSQALTKIVYERLGNLDRVAISDNELAKLLKLKVETVARIISQAKADNKISTIKIDNIRYFIRPQDIVKVELPKSNKLF